MKKSLLLKVGASLLAVFLMAACNNTEDTETEDTTNTEETEEGTETQEGTETEEETTEEAE
jgi:protein involved in sex pheromone biosynthesis